jgi:hypothetical protein
LEASVERNARANQANTRLDTFTKQYAHLSNVFRYIEVFPEWMVARIANNANGNNSNSFGAAPGSLAIKADITIPGISGLRAGELFWLDRIPAFYRAYGAFIITNLTDSMTRDGWTTNINGVFFYLGNAWKQTMANLLIEGVQ